MRSKKIIIAMTIIMALFSGSALAKTYSQKDFIDRFAFCSYGYFEAGMKTTATGDERKLAIRRFGSNLNKVEFSLDIPLNDESLSYMCEQYRDTSVATDFTKSGFRRLIVEAGLGDIINAFERAH